MLVTTRRQYYASLRIVLSRDGVPWVITFHFSGKVDKYFDQMLVYVYIEIHIEKWVTAVKAEHTSWNVNCELALTMS